mmetsp:Transcript_4794/g.14877  ORF Transcript_4794/g.14877 Transcript_4794/m.14877 type:complete len:105 (-) Transcript_4794:309-623(-)
MLTMEAQLEKERARANKYKSQLEQLKVAKTALEAELSMMSSLSPTAQRSAGGVIPPYLPQQPNGEAGKGDTPRQALLLSLNIASVGLPVQILPSQRQIAQSEES